MNVFLLMLALHFLCDYPLQGDFLAKAKNHRAPIAGVPWYQALVAHAYIQAAAVSLLTGSVTLGMCEFVAHAAIDYTKSEGAISYNFDQALHLICKVVWVMVLPYVTF